MHWMIKIYVHSYIYIKIYVHYSFQKFCGISREMFEELFSQFGYAKKMFSLILLNNDLVTRVCFFVYKMKYLQPTLKKLSENLTKCK